MSALPHYDLLRKWMKQAKGIANALILAHPQIDDESMMFALRAIDELIEEAEASVQHLWDHVVMLHGNAQP